MMRTIQLLIIAALIPFGASCEAKPNPVHFVLPDGYRGGFVILPDSPDGITLEKRGGQYVIEIPESGVLKINGYDPFGSYTRTASFAGGDSLVVPRENDIRSTAGAVALKGMGTQVLYEGDKPINQYWWFVGTEEEWNAFPDHDSRFKPGGVVRKGK